MTRVGRTTIFIQAERLSSVARREQLQMRH